MPLIEIVADADELKNSLTEGRIVLRRHPGTAMVFNQPGRIVSVEETIVVTQALNADYHGDKKGWLFNDSHKEAEIAVSRDEIGVVCDSADEANAVVRIGRTAMEDYEALARDVASRYNDLVDVEVPKANVRKLR